ncbi:MAG: endopeptidase La, partial [Gaiellaceae bacterium]
MSDLNLEEPFEPGDVEIPSTLPVLPLKETVIFPQSVSPLAIGQERSVRLVDDVLEGNRMLALVTVRNGEVDEPGWDDLYEIGTAALVHKMIRVPDGTLRILVQGVGRIRLQRRVQDDPYLAGEFEVVPDEVEETPELEALTRSVQTEFGRLISLVPYLPSELELAAANVDDPGALSHLVASTLRLKTEEKQALLEQADVSERLRDVLRILKRELEVVELGTKIQSQVQSELEKGQREYFLRQQLKAIQDELGEGDEQQAEINELRQQIEEKNLPEDTRKAIERELSRLEKLPPAAAEYGVIRTYIDWILSLPWTETTEDNLDLGRAREILDEDHYDLEKVKERILEYLAVSKLKNDLSGPILCFVGPPGVGKTSLGQSIARTVGRRFVRLSVGGVRDEAEIRGHRRTYIGAMPGTIIRSLRDAETKNPVLLIDEIDKMGADFRGDPASAMLEVLDRAQNCTFRDHYLDLPFDLSKTLFICTANTVDTIPPALADRMDVIHLSGYTEDEKLGIARKYLVPKQLEAHGLSEEQLSIGDEVLRVVTREYTREAGVRNLERRMADLFRKAAREIAEGKADSVDVDESTARGWLGPRRFPADPRKRTADPGVATGLAFTPVGGDVLFIEATAYPGKGKLTIT